jgi:hypothetical protein
LLEAPANSIGNSQLQLWARAIAQLGPIELTIGISSIEKLLFAREDS